MKVYSFDVFDTCLIRKCGEPQNVLDILSRLVYEDSVSDMDRRAFVIARRMADCNVYNNEFARLSDIYDNMAYSHPLLKTKEELMQLESDLERAMLVPIPEMKRKIAELRLQGAHIIFISDMYLPQDFIAGVLQNADIMKPEDSIYVSCEVGKRKVDGNLYRYIKQKENLTFHNWCHYGDNTISDYQIPRALGIKAKLVDWSYSVYQNRWIKDYCNPQNRVFETLAGVCRTLVHTLPQSNHKLFLLDLAAPLFVSFTYRTLLRARKDGLKHLFFCARDAKMIYLISELFQPLFSDIKLHYLYISRDALYNGDSVARMAYFRQCGLASKKDKCAIVDLRTSGKTLCVLNRQLKEEGYIPITGYFLEMFCTGTIDNIPEQYYAELHTPYYMQKKYCRDIFRHHYLIEMFISIHNEKRTIDYAIDNNQHAYPVFAQGETESSEDRCYMPDSEKRCVEHRNTLLAFTKYFIETKLYYFVDDIFRIAIEDWRRFASSPDEQYLCALEDFYSCRPGQTELLPYVKKMGIAEMLRTRGNNTLWRLGTLRYSLPILGDAYSKMMNR